VIRDGGSSLPGQKVAVWTAFPMARVPSDEARRSEEHLLSQCDHLRPLPVREQ
jgi:hypothetical protein